MCFLVTQDAFAFTRENDRHEMDILDEEELSKEQVKDVCANCKLGFLLKEEVVDMEEKVGKQLIELFMKSLLDGWCNKMRVKDLAEIRRFAQGEKLLLEFPGLLLSLVRDVSTPHL